MTEGRHHLRDGVRVHVDGLNGDEGAQACRALNDDLRHQPSVDEPIVGIDENPLAPGPLTPARHVGHPLRVGVAVSVAGLRAGREHFEARIGQAIQASAHACSLLSSLTVRSEERPDSIGAPVRTRSPGRHAWAVPRDLPGYSADRVGKARWAEGLEPLSEHDCCVWATAPDDSPQRTGRARTNIPRSASAAAAS